MTMPGKWGVPDWTDAAAYALDDPHCQMRRWTWQFLRRNKEYRAFYVNKCLPVMDEEGSIGDDDYHVLEETEKRFGFHFPKDPADPNPPWLFTTDFVRMVGGRTVKSEARLCLDVTEVGFIFDLTRPLDVQFALAEKKAQRLQEHRNQKNKWKIKSIRERTDKYPNYLRIIDAYDAGARAREIADVIFPEIEHYSPESPRDKALQNHKKAAFELRDWGYRGLSSRGSDPNRAK